MLGSLAKEERGFPLNRESHQNFILQGHVISYLKRSWGVDEIRCFRCRKQLQVGDLVHRRIKAGRLRIYHVGCWDSMLLDLSREPIEVEKASVFSQSLLQPEARILFFLSWRSEIGGPLL